MSRHLLWCIALILHLPAASHASRPNDPRMNNYDVEHYDLSLSFNLAARTFRGDVALAARTVAPMEEFVVSASNETLTIDSVISHGSHLPFEHRNDHVVVSLGSRAPSAGFEIRVFYHGTSSFKGDYDDGGVLMPDSGGPVRLATISEPNFARRWWPCKDMPSDKATVTINATVPEGLIAVSNGLLAKSEKHGGLATFSWNTRYPISTYLVAISAAPYKEIRERYTALDGRQMTMSYYVYPEDSAKAAADFQNTGAILGFFAGKFGEYPFLDEKFGHVEVDGDLTMENQTLCSISNHLITGTRSNEMVFVHETAHQWWGDLITPADWRNTWLSEGFATYAEALYLEHTRGHDGYQEFIDRIMAEEPGRFAGSVIGQSDTAFWDSFGSRVYFKGALVLHMLRGMVGDSTFFAILRNYANDSRLRYANARTEDFVAECERTSGQKLDWFFNQWIFAHTDSVDRPHFIYDWTSGPAESGFQATLRLRQENAAELVYRVPLQISIAKADSAQTFTVVDSLAVQTFVFLLRHKPDSLEIDNKNLIFKSLTRGGGF